VRNGTQEILDAMRSYWPGWRIWVVYPVIGPVIWCAHPLGDERHVINTSSSDELAEVIGKQEAGS
jgi:hypothetical protein